MAQIHNDITNNIEQHGAYYAWYKLRKAGKSAEQCHDLMDEINFYIDGEAIDKAERMIRSEKSALTELNNFFANI